MKKNIVDLFFKEEIVSFISTLSHSRKPNEIIAQTACTQFHISAVQSTDYTLSTVTIKDT